MDEILHTKLGPGLDRDPLQDKQEVSAVASNEGAIFLPIDGRRLLSIISDINDEWDGTKMEKQAIAYGVTRFHKMLCDKLEKEN